MVRAGMSLSLPALQQCSANSTRPVRIQLPRFVHFSERSTTGALAAGTQLPSIRSLAETLVINPHTVARVYRDLESEGTIEIRHGLGAFVAEAWRERVQSNRMRSAQKLVRTVVKQLKALGLEEDEIRRLVEAETAAHELVPGRR